MESAGVLAERFRTNSEESPPWDFQAAAPVARFVTPSARSQFAAFNASAGIARWIPAAGTVRSLYFHEPRSRYQVRFAKSRAPATEVQRNERAFARTAVSRSTTSRTRVPNSSASMSEASTVPCLSSPPSSSTPRAAMPGIFWTLTFPSCRSGIRTRNSNRAIRKKRPVRVNRVTLTARRELLLFPDQRTSPTLGSRDTVSDLAEVWEASGKAMLEMLATDDPGKLPQIGY